MFFQFDFGTILRKNEQKIPDFNLKLKAKERWLSTLFISGWDLEIEIPSGIKPSLPRSENVEIWL